MFVVAFSTYPLNFPGVKTSTLYWTGKRSCSNKLNRFNFDYTRWSPVQSDAFTYKTMSDARRALSRLAAALPDEFYALFRNCSFIIFNPSNSRDCYYHYPVIKI